jgi:predicted DNA-binding protein with PD1-like motif
MSMEYRKYAGTYYIRVDRNDEIISSILAVCSAEGVKSAIYTGIGGCKEAQIQTFLPEVGEFETRTLRGMLELVSLTGNVVSDDEGGLSHHTHAAFAYKEGDEHRFAAGHIKSITVLYTAEIELRPVVGGAIGKQYDPETGTGFWSFEA